MSANTAAAADPIEEFVIGQEFQGAAGFGVDQEYAAVGFPFPGAGEVDSTDGFEQLVDYVSGYGA